MSKPSSRAGDLSSVDLKGLITPAGKKWIRVAYDGQKVWVPRSEFAGRGNRAMERLAEHEIVFIGSSAWSQVMEKVKSVDRFAKRTVVQGPGWTGDSFALQNGEVFSPSGKPSAVRLFEPDQAKCARAGILRGWLREVARPLTGQTLAVFLLMLVFAAPLLKLVRRTGNFGIEIVGPAGTGKTFLLQLMASVIGGAIDGEDSKYWVRFHTTVNAVEDIAEAHSDLSLLLDDATSFAADSGRTNKGRSLFAAIFGLAQGQGKFRKGAKQPTTPRTVYAVTSNRTSGNVIAGIDREDSEAAADRLLTLDLSKRNNRNFDSIPDAFADGTEFSRFLINAMARHHGTAMPRFLQKLVDYKARDEANLRDGIQRRIDSFLSKFRLDRDFGSDMRVAEAFGLFSAGGQLAQHYGALPKQFDCEAAAVACYRLFQASTKRVSYVERLLELAADPNVIDLDARGRKHLTKRELRSVPGVFRTSSRGKREFIVEPGTGMRLFTRLRRWLSWKAYKRASRWHPGVRGQLMYERSRVTGEPLPEEERARTLRLGECLLLR